MAGKVMLYALSTCSHCRNTKRFLDENNITYAFVYVDQTSEDERKALIEEIKKYNANLTFPPLIIGNEVIVGFREDEIKGALGL